VNISLSTLILVPANLPKSTISPSLIIVLYSGTPVAITSPVVGCVFPWLGNIIPPFDVSSTSISFINTLFLVGFNFILIPL